MPQRNLIRAPMTKMKHADLAKGANAAPQQTRSRLMRKRICEATTRCLYRYGYAETTISRVIEEADVSNGALHHHFPTREHLMAATADHLLERGRKHPAPRHIDRSGELDEIASRLRHGWTHMVNTPDYRALLEILNAVRTDKALKAAIGDSLAHQHAFILEAAGMIYMAADGDDQTVVDLMIMHMSLMRGLVIQEQYGRDRAHLDAMVERWIRLITPLLRLAPTQEENGDHG